MMSAISDTFSLEPLKEVNVITIELGYYMGGYTEYKADTSFTTGSIRKHQDDVVIA